MKRRDVLKSMAVMPAVGTGFVGLKDFYKYLLGLFGEGKFTVDYEERIIYITRTVNFSELSEAIGTPGRIDHWDIIFDRDIFAMVSNNESSKVGIVFDDDSQSMSYCTLHRGAFIRGPGVNWTLG